MVRSLLLFIVAALSPPVFLRSDPTEATEIQVIQDEDVPAGASEARGRGLSAVRNWLGDDCRLRLCVGAKETGDLDSGQIAQRVEPPLSR